MNEVYRKGLFFIVICYWVALLVPTSVCSQELTDSGLQNEYQIHSTDIAHFYTAFDLAIQQPEKAEKIFNSLYFKKGTSGLRDFYKTKIKSKTEFAEFVLTFKAYYQSIRGDISDLNDLKLLIEAYFNEFRTLYSKATIPDVFFMIGKFQSNGTISKNGLLIGTEILARTVTSDTSNWNRDLLAISMERSHIPVTVIHELVQFNQEQQKKGNSLLWKSIREGSAEFIAELLTGETDGDYREFEGIEKMIWEQFLLQKDQPIWSSWMKANKSRPALAGYWMGYMICKAYYLQVNDKTQAIHDILTIQDYEEFLRKSKVEKYLNCAYCC
ncbi:gliding motility protein GldB-related protein [Algoriphagus resistens]|uniref:gliding motility protein GldB-related protein n=1 Tax=Algoriphagus resistens TaxID=1750590 RepID=UPI0007168C1D|nr:DUF2268 domain-containing putative Zn-dependent protease [Algoriphagus resistens]